LPCRGARFRTNAKRFDRGARGPNESYGSKLNKDHNEANHRILRVANEPCVLMSSSSSSSREGALPIRRASRVVYFIVYLYRRPSDVLLTYSRRPSILLPSLSHGVIVEGPCLSPTREASISRSNHNIHEPLKTTFLDCISAFSVLDKAYLVLAFVRETRIYTFFLHPA